MSAISMFSSPRERQLWIWVFVVVLGIFASLFLAQRFAGIFEEEGILTAFFLFGMLTVGGAVLMLAVKVRLRGIEIGVLVSIAAVYWMVLVRMTIPAERTHLIEYSVLGVLVFEVLMERKQNGRAVPMPAVLAMAATALLGLVDEGLQAILPGRVFDLRDIGFNALAGFLAVSTSLVISLARRRGKTDRISSGG